MEATGLSFIARGGNGVAFVSGTNFNIIASAFNKGDTNMIDRHVPGRVHENGGTARGAFETPWSSPGLIRELNNRNDFSQANRGLPGFEITGDDSTMSRPAANRNPNIINLVGGGTKDISQADEPAGDRGGRPRVRLSDRDYAEKMRHVEQEERNIRIKKQNAGR